MYIILESKGRKKRKSKCGDEGRQEGSFKGQIEVMMGQKEAVTCNPFLGLAKDCRYAVVTPANSPMCPGAC